MTGSHRPLIKTLFIFDPTNMTENVEKSPCLLLRTQLEMFQPFIKIYICTFLNATTQLEMSQPLVKKDSFVATNTFVNILTSHKKIPNHRLLSIRIGVKPLSFPLIRPCLHENVPLKTE